MQEERRSSPWGVQGDYKQPVTLPLSAFAAANVYVCVCL